MKFTKANLAQIGGTYQVVFHFHDHSHKSFITISSKYGYKVWTTEIFTEKAVGFFGEERSVTHTGNSPVFEFANFSEAKKKFLRLIKNRETLGGFIAS